MSYNSANIFVKAVSIWNGYVDSAGSTLSSGNGEIRILAWKII
ncbi:MAG: hypothetical protein ABH857_01810 [Elusimicrobiota bacterium]